LGEGCPSCGKYNERRCGGKGKNGKRIRNRVTLQRLEERSNCQVFKDLKTGTHLYRSEPVKPLEGVKNNLGEDRTEGSESDKKEDSGSGLVKDGQEFRRTVIKNCPGEGEVSKNLGGSKRTGKNWKGPWFILENKPSY